MKPLDPIALTRRLVDIESLTYNEGAVGEYLDTFLRERGFAVERMAVAQPTPSHYSGPRFNVYAGNGGPARCRAFHAHGYGASFYSQPRG